MAYQSEIPTIADPESVDMHEMYGSDPDYREYWRVLHGSYIGALMHRAQELKAAKKARKIAGGDAKSRGKKSKAPANAADSDFAAPEIERPISASTLHPALQKAFREAQKEIEWRGPESMIGAGAGALAPASASDSTSAPAPAAEEDFGQAVGAGPAAEESDFGTTVVPPAEEEKEQDFATSL